ncbi:MAG: RNA polymerase sigma factor [Bacteroidetes bacterium]|nr:RNA polymerase sigma factor [Bacteroidota bacterium]
MKVSYIILEEEIITGCIRQDRTAQKRLYEKHYPKMMGVCMRYAGQRDVAMEMVNTGFMKVFDGIEKFHKQGGNLEAWIYRIMVNTAIDYLRKEMRHHHADIEKSVYVEDVSDVISDISAEQIMEMVKKLTPAYRAVFNLYVVEGYNHSEIGEKLGISEGTSKSNLAKARAKMQEMIIESNKVIRSSYGL